MSRGKSQCRYCHRPVDYRGLKRHESVCVRNPVVSRAVRKLLHRLSFQGVICTHTDYDHAARGSNLPCATWLLRHFGSWDDVAKFFSLRPHGEMRATRAAAAQQMVFDLSAKLHGGKFAPTSREYDVARGTDLPSSCVLARPYGGWLKYTKALGLRRASPNYYRRTAAARERRAVRRQQARFTRLRDVEERLMRHAEEAGPRGHAVTGGAYFSATTHRWSCDV